MNEITLFRHFLNKERLLDAVLQRTFDQQDAAASHSPTNGNDRGAAQTRPALRDELASFARRYELLLRGNILLLRTLLGEIHRHRDHEARMLKCLFAPLKAELLGFINAAREDGAIRSEIEPAMAVDLFSSTIFVDVLRRSLQSEPEYSTDEYLETTVDLFARGMEP